MVQTPNVLNLNKCARMIYNLHMYTTPPTTQSNTIDIMNQDVTHISIGGNCAPRSFLKTKLNLSKQDGYNSCPFDLCITPYEALCKALETDFASFFDDLHMIAWSNAEGNRSLAGPGLFAISNTYGITFNHEGGGHSHLFKHGTNDDMFYVRNDFSEFRKRYENRISNFRTYCKHAQEIVLVHNH